uniref:Zinc finger protein 830 n=1 Tax=Trichuris muris TaxID=70415 RepID=A0A5S6QKV8_TRIMR
MAAYKVNSAYAKFSSSGGLSCTLCNCSVKSAKVWIAHERGRAHIEKLRALKAQSSREAAQASSVEKRKAEVDEANSDPKRARLSDNESDGSSEFSAEEAAGLPEDFFDQSMETSAAPEIVGNVQENVENSASQLQGVASEAPGAGIPEGFFDDPLEDAKKRGAELKDPLDEEWSRFQREIVMEENLAEEMLEGDLEQMNLERSLEELDEEIRGWARVNLWEKKVEEALGKPRSAASVPSSPESLSDFESDGADLEAILDWRSKEYL